MSVRRRIGCDRRRFLALAGCLLASPAWAGPGAREEGEGARTAGPRATSGDVREPDWGERLTVTVGPKGADLNGADDKVIQAAADYVTRLGGGTVQILPGTYRMRNSVFLPTHVRIIDSGPDDGVGVDVRGETEGVEIVRNEVRETRGPSRRVGIRIGPKARTIALVENRIEGYSRDVIDLAQS